MEKVIIPTLMGGQLDIDVDPNPNGLPFAEIVYRIARQRNWIRLSKEQLEELITTLQRAQAEM